MYNPCPVCCAAEHDIISTLCLNMSVLGSSFLPGAAHNAACAKCGCVYVRSEATGGDFLNYYMTTAQGVDYNKLFGERQTRAYYRRILENIRPYINPAGAILDCGTGLGDFAAFLREQGYTGVLGMDPSPSCAASARGKGVMCVLDDAFSPSPAYKGRFDLIVLSHVLEHIKHPRAALENLKGMLKPGGVIYIEVPDAARYAEVSFTPYFFFTYEHLCHYTELTLLNMARSGGCEAIDTGAFFKCERYHVIYALVKTAASPCETAYDSDARDAIEGYAAFSADSLRTFTQPLEQTGEPLILWGIGASTAQLLNGTFDRCNVTQLIDASKARQGLAFPMAGKTLTIEPPEAAGEGTVVILPVMYKDAIKRDIREMGLNNALITLSD